MKNTTFSFLMKYVFKKWYWVIGSVFFSALTVAGSLFIPKFTGKGVDMVIEKGNVDFFSLKQIIVYILVLIGVTIVSQLLLSLINNRLTAGVVSEIRKDAMQKIHRLPISYVDSHPQGDLVSRMIADVETLSDGLLMGFTQFFTGVLTILGTLILMVIMDWRITVVVVFVTPLSFFVAGFVSKRTYSLFQKQTEARSTQVSFINEMVSNQKVVRAFGKEEENIEKFEKMNRALKDASLKATFYSSLTNPSTRFVNALVYAGVAIFGAMAIVTKGLLSIGELTVFLSYANQYTKPFNEISGVITEFQNALACADRIREFLNEKEEAQTETNESAAKIDEFKNLEFRNVYFSYTEKQKLIEDFSLKVEKGLRVAIVGPTGCGKTTLINLIMRFYDVNAGEILMNGINIQKFDRKDYRDNFGMVLQETWLRKGSVRDNITLGRDISDEEVINACRECHAHRFIERMKDGYNTQISEDGGNLSNGQKQLL